MDVVGLQGDQPALCVDAVGLHQPALIDHAATELRCGSGREVDLSPIGPDAAGLLNQGVEFPFLDFDQGRSTQVHPDFSTRGERDRSPWGHDTSVVDDLRSHQGHAASLGCADLAPVGHGLRAVPSQAVLAGHEIGGPHAQGGGHQTAYVHLCGGSEKDAVGIEQIDTAVGAELPLDRGHIAAQHPIECCGLRVGLDESDGLARTDAETLPVHRHAWAGLSDRHHLALRLHAALARHDLSARGQGATGLAPGRAGQTGAGCQPQAGDLALACRRGHLGRHHELLPCVAPDHLANGVHAADPGVLMGCALLQS